jgi:hypothetical protein
MYAGPLAHRQALKNSDVIRAVCDTIEILVQPFAI